MGRKGKILVWWRNVNYSELMIYLCVVAQPSKTTTKCVIKLLCMTYVKLITCSSFIATQEFEGKPCSMGTRNWRHPLQWPISSIMQIRLKIRINTDAMLRNCEHNSKDFLIIFDFSFFWLTSNWSEGWWILSDVHFYLFFLFNFLHFLILVIFMLIFSYEFYLESIFQGLIFQWK